MTTINEIERYPASDGGFSGLLIEVVDGKKSKQYLLGFSGRNGYVTVLCGKEWINSRRAYGKTFWRRADLTRHYLAHGEILARYADESGCWPKAA